MIRSIIVLAAMMLLFGALFAVAPEPTHACQAAYNNCIALCRGDAACMQNCMVGFNMCKQQEQQQLQQQRKRTPPPPPPPWDRRKGPRPRG